MPNRLQHPAQDAACRFERSSVDDWRGKSAILEGGDLLAGAEVEPGQHGVRSAEEEQIGVAGAVAAAHDGEDLHGKAVGSAGKRADGVLDNRGRVAALVPAQALAEGGLRDAFGGFGMGELLLAKAIFLPPAEDGPGVDGVFRSARRFERALLIFVEYPGGNDAADDACREAAKKLDLAPLLCVFFGILF